MDRRITEEQFKEIKRLHQDGLRNFEIAKKLDITGQDVYNWLNNTNKNKKRNCKSCGNKCYGRRCWDCYSAKKWGQVSRFTKKRKSI